MVGTFEMHAITFKHFGERSLTSNGRFDYRSISHTYEDYGIVIFPYSG